MLRRRPKGAAAGDPPPLGDDEVGDHIRPFAEIFVEGSAEEGVHFDFSPSAAALLDPAVDLFLESCPSEDVMDSMALSMGAFLGELVIRNAHGSWTLVDGMPGVRLPSGLVCFPVNKVGKRLRVGPEHSLLQFYEVAVADRLPPEARRIRRR